MLTATSQLDGSEDLSHNGRIRHLFWASWSPSNYDFIPQEYNAVAHFQAFCPNDNDLSISWLEFDPKKAYGYLQEPPSYFMILAYYINKYSFQIKDYEFKPFYLFLFRIIKNRKVIKLCKSSQNKYSIECDIYYLFIATIKQLINIIYN